jgi:hypothetical protein
MTTLFKQTKSKTPNASARVVDGKLILSLPEAITPVVWQMDLNQAKASALEVHVKEASTFNALILKTPKGENIEIAVFETREQAVAGLMAAAAALENAQGQIRPFTQDMPATAAQYNAAPAPRGSVFKTIGMVAAGLLFLFVLINIWGAMMPRQPGGLEPAAGSAPEINAPEAGVPLSADDFLNSR